MEDEFIIEGWGGNSGMLTVSPANCDWIERGKTIRFRAVEDDNEITVECADVNRIRAFRDFLTRCIERMEP